MGHFNTFSQGADESFGLTLIVKAVNSSDLFPLPSLLW